MRTRDLLHHTLLLHCNLHNSKFKEKKRKEKKTQHHNNVQNHPIKYTIKVFLLHKTKTTAQASSMFSSFQFCRKQ